MAHGSWYLKKEDMDFAILQWIAHIKKLRFRQTMPWL
jgi:hypothetical protein